MKMVDRKLLCRYLPLAVATERKGRMYPRDVVKEEAAGFSDRQTDRM